VVDSVTTQTIVNNPEILKERKLKDCIINFLNNNTSKTNVSGKLKIKIGSETLNIDDAVFLKKGRRNLLSIIDLLDNNINCLFYSKNNKKYLNLFKDDINQLKLNNIIINVTKVSTSKIVAMVHWLVTMTIRLNLQGLTHTLSKI